MLLRVFAFITDYASSCWPQRVDRTAASALPLFGVSFLFWIIFSIDWASAAQMRPDWQGALWVLVMGAVALCFLGPLMWLLDRVFKPFSRRTGQHFLGALGFISVCGVWWSGLVLGLLAISGKSWW